MLWTSLRRTTRPSLCFSIFRESGVGARGGGGQRSRLIGRASASWHVTHTPLEAPAQFIYPLLPSYNSTDKNRQLMNAMVTAMDSGIRNVTEALKRRGMWNSTLLAFSADNGGWGGETGGNSYPVRLSHARVLRIAPCLLVCNLSTAAWNKAVGL